MSIGINWMEHSDHYPAQAVQLLSMLGLLKNVNPICSSQSWTDEEQRFADNELLSASILQMRC
jgi:hypothetical protein